jgi:hypothetical protein
MIHEVYRLQSTDRCSGRCVISFDIIFFIFFPNTAAAIQYCDEIKDPCGDPVGVANCTNLNPLYKCQCKKGYVLDPVGRHCSSKFT